MELQVTDLTTLDAELVAQRQAQLAQLLSEAHPTVDWRRGVAHDLLLHVAALLGVAEERNIDLWETSHTLALLAAAPPAADALVDQLLQNYRITRRAAAAATGDVTVVVSQLLAVNIPAGATFTANGMRFAATQAVAARVSAATVQSDADRLLQPLGNGTYAFSVPVMATTTGTAGLVRRNALMLPDFTLQFYVTSYAAADFVGAADGETNAELAAKALTGIAAQAWSNRDNIYSLIVGQPDFAETLAVSVVGAGDVEMSRDQRTVFPISMGGRSDVYARTRQLPLSLALTKTCTLVDVQLTGSVWQFTLTKDEAPGYYRVENILPLGAAEQPGFEVVSDERGVDLSGTGLLPDVVGDEGVYTRYQTAVVRFFVTDDLADGLVVNESTRDYAVTLSALPKLAELQDFLCSRGVIDPAGDVLVKAPLPCFVSLTFNVYLPSGVADLNPAEIAAAVAADVNRQGFTGALYASTISDRVHDFLPAGSAVSAVEMFGRIRLPSGRYRYLRSTEALHVPTVPAEQLSGRTCAFFLDPRDVDVTVTRIASLGG